MMLMMTVIKSLFDNGSSGDGGIPKGCPITSIPSLPPPPVPSHQPQDDIRGSPPAGCSVLTGCCPKWGAWVGAGCKKIFALNFFRPFSTSGKGVGLPFLWPMDESERWRAGAFRLSLVYGPEQTLIYDQFSRYAPLSVVIWAYFHLKKTFFKV